VVDCIIAAAREGAALVVFSETFIPGYPAWIWRLRPGSDWGTNEAMYARLMDNAVDLSSDDLKAVFDAAREHSITVACGIEERAENSGTLYNSYIVIGSDGELLNHHRKLMPTNPERMVWGFGDASGLKVVDTEAGRVGSLVCWENYMPLARYAMYAQGVELYLAPTYDSGDDWLGTLQHIAREGRCYVIGCGNLLQARNIPDDLPEKAALYPDQNEWINPGDSIIIAPGGNIVAGPLKQEDGILYAELDLDEVAKSKRALDVAGHYSRPDIFNLQVNDTKTSPLTFSSEKGDWK
jgi:nitrilase